MITDTTAPRADADALAGLTQLSDDEIAAVSGGCLIGELISIVRDALHGIPHMR